MADNTETFIIKLKDSGVSSGLDKADAKTKKLRNSVENTNSSVGGLKTAFGALLATGLIFKGISNSIDAFDKQEQAMAQVRQGIETTGGAAGKTFDDLAGFASNLQNNTLFGDEDILQNATAQLLTFTNIAGEQFDRTTAAALDLSTRLGGDLKSSSIQLGKALNDPAANLSALSRSGIQFTKEQKSVIKNLQETNRLAEAQDIILTELEKQYGGSAAAAAKAGKGGFVQLGNSIGDVSEDIGGLIIEALNPLVPTFKSVVASIGGFFKMLRENVDTVTAVVAVVAGAVAPFLAVTTATKIWTVALKAVTTATKIWTGVQWLLNVALKDNPIGLVVAAIGALVAGIVIAWQRSETFRGVVLGLWESLKVVGSFIADLFAPQIMLISSAFDFVKTNIFDRLGEIKAFVFDTFKSILKFISPVLDILGAPIKGAIDFVSGASDGDGIIGKVAGAFSDAFNKEVSKTEADEAKDKGVSKKSPLSTFKGQFTGAADLQKGLGSGISEIKASAPKNFTINIDSLVKELSFNTTNIKESTSRIREEITKALLTAVNDAQVIAQ